ncbi:MAG: paraquat-inducible protein A [Chitinophagaceae bacterium]|nr:paraquat-inducible protein A [Chitinophagaceae bacterium]
MNRFVLLGLHIISLVLLGLGWVLDMLHIDISIHTIISFNLFDEKRSVLTTLKSLWQSNDYWPFLLIFFFGIVVPLVKSGLIFYLLSVKNPSQKVYKIVNAISKWAMADVFAISIFVAFLGAKAMESTKANLEPGFYYFAGYVVLSGIVVMLLGKLMKTAENSNA